MSQIKHTQTKEGGAFYYESEGKRMAAMTYVASGEKTIIIDHTEVDPSLQGQGIGKQLQAELVAYVRKNDIRVVPVCRFATANFRKMPEWQDVLT